VLALRTRLVVAIVLGLVGLGWVGQGLGILPFGFMSGQTFWALAGVVLLGVAAYLAWGARPRG
jgi:hypothetical protein